MEETFQTRDRNQQVKANFTPTEQQAIERQTPVHRGWQPVILSLCACSLVLSLSAGSSPAVLSAETTTEVDEAPVLRSTIIQTECKGPQSPTVNTGDLKVVEAGTSLELLLSTEIDPGVNAEGDEFFGKICKDVLVDGRVVIPRGTQLHGVLSTMEGPKRAGRNGYINACFDYLTTPDGRVIAIEGNSTTRNSKGKAAAKVVGRAAGYTALGGVIGTVIVLRYGGLAAVAASHGYALAGGAAIGGAAGMTIAMLTKGKSAMLQPGAEMHVKLSEPLKLPTMTMPDETAEDFSAPGLTVKVTNVRIDRRPVGEGTEITLTLDILNQTENTFSTFEIGLEDEQGNVFFPSTLGDTGMLSSKIKPGSHFNSQISFIVDNGKFRHKLLFFKPYSRDALAKFALTDAMLAGGKASPKGKRVATETGSAMPPQAISRRSPPR
ncbi:MAG: hypothetical protein K2X27_12445 [Candidatus Obscuribacterales bacterium]|nr:hypothetical protein [Candidatus Obscuribacterales bacterium]